MLRKKCILMVTALFCLGVFVLPVIPGSASAASGPATASGKARKALQVLDPVGLLSAADATMPPATRLKGLGGKKVWIVVVDFGSTLMPAVAKLLPRYARGVKVRTVLVSEKGNPFFMLKPEDRPDAVIAGVGLCEATTLEATNYAKQAEKLDIPAVMIFNSDILFAYREAMDKLKVPNVRAYATGMPDPANSGDPERLARMLIPQLVEGVTKPITADRPRIGFRGTEAKALAAFAALRWTGGAPVVLPTEERVAALLKGTSHKPADVVGVMAPGMRQATVEKVAVHAVMAGCTPEQMPVALALAELLCQKRVAEELGQREPPVLQIVLGGPAAGTIGAAGSAGADSLARLVRLMLIHLGGVPGPALEAKRLRATLPEQGKTGESTVALFDVDHAGAWKQSTTLVDRWR